MRGFEITCANKNPNGVIVRVGGQGWSLAIHEAIVKMVSGQIRLSILVGNAVYDVGIRGDGEDAYLVLEPEGKPLHDLDGLRSC